MDFHSFRYCLSVKFRAVFEHLFLTEFKLRHIIESEHLFVYY